MITNQKYYRIFKVNDVKWEVWKVVRKTLSDKSSCFRTTTQVHYVVLIITIEYQKEYVPLLHI